MAFDPDRGTVIEANLSCDDDSKLILIKNATAFRRKDQPSLYPDPYTMTPPDKTHAIVYYSRTGHTDKLAHRLAKPLKADVFPILVARYPKGLPGYLRAGFDSLTGGVPAIAPVADLRHYASVSLGAPIWTSTLASPLRAYLAQSPDLPETVGLFLTCGAASPDQKAFTMADTLLGRRVTARLIIPNGLDDASVEARTRSYCDALDASVGVQGPP